MPWNQYNDASSFALCSRLHSLLGLCASTYSLESFSNSWKNVFGILMESLTMNLSRMDVLAILNCSILNVLIFSFSAFKFHSSFVSLIKFYSLVLFVVWWYSYLVILNFGCFTI